MLNKKKDFKDTKFGQFLSKAGQSIPEILSIGGEILTGDIGGAVEKVGDILKQKAETNAQAAQLLKEFELAKMDFKKEVFALEVKDRDSARELFKIDSAMQKLLAIVFTVAYFYICNVLLKHFFNNSNLKLEDYELGFISTLFGAMSSKVNTIIDFFFGGSVK